MLGLLFRKRGEKYKTNKKKSQRFQISTQIHKLRQMNKKPKKKMNKIPLRTVDSMRESLIFINDAKQLQMMMRVTNIQTNKQTKTVRKKVNTKQTQKLKSNKKKDKDKQIKLQLFHFYKQTKTNKQKRANPT